MNLLVLFLVSPVPPIKICWRPLLKRKKEKRNTWRLFARLSVPYLERQDRQEQGIYILDQKSLSVFIRTKSLSSSSLSWTWPSFSLLVRFSIMVFAASEYLREKKWIFFYVLTNNFLFLRNIMILERNRK